LAWDVTAKQNTLSNLLPSPVTMHNVKRFKKNLYDFALLLLVLVNAVMYDSNKQQINDNHTVR